MLILQIWISLPGGWETTLVIQVSILAPISTLTVSLNSWRVDTDSGLVTVDCEEVGVELSVPLQPDSNRVRVLSSAGDAIEDCHRYRGEPLVNIEHTKTATSVTWWSTYSLVFPLSERWALTVRDNGDRCVKLEFHSVVDRIISDPPTQRDVAVHIVEIAW